jgi:hypothetical protein
MDARREPRFSIYGPVKVTLLTKPDRVLECVLLDISATGLKLIVPENVATDEILSIEAEEHLALAEVRYSLPRGDKFTVGCERIHVLNKATLPEDTAQSDQLRLLVEDYRSYIRDGLAAPRPDANPGDATRLDRQLSERFGPMTAPAEKAAPPAEKDVVPPINPSVFATRDQLLDAAAGWVGENWEKIPASPNEKSAGRSEIIDRLTFHLSEKLRPPTEAAPLAAAPPETGKPKRARVKVKANFRQYRLPAGIAAAAVLGWGLSALFWSLGVTSVASRLPASIAAFISKDPAPAAPANPIRHARLKIVETTWVTATPDGKRLFNKKLVKGDVREIDFKDKLLLHVGNARGIEISVDGKLIGSIGGRGQSRMLELSANGLRYLPVN